jgi:hypothetical protein
MRDLKPIRTLVATALILIASLCAAAASQAQLSSANIPGGTSAGAYTPDDPVVAPVADSPVLAFSRLVSSWRVALAPRFATIARWSPRTASDAAPRQPAVDRTRAARLGAR